MLAFSGVQNRAISSEISKLSRQLKRDGYVIIPNLADTATLDRLYDDLDPYFRAASFGTGPFYGETTKRFGRILARSSQAEQFVLHPLAYGIVEAILSQYCETIQLNLTQAIEIEPENI
jgi:hypothetical protein